MTFQLNSIQNVRCSVFAFSEQSQANQSKTEETNASNKLSDFTLFMLSNNIFFFWLRPMCIKLIGCDHFYYSIILLTMMIYVLHLKCVCISAAVFVLFFLFRSVLFHSFVDLVAGSIDRWFILRFVCIAERSKMCFDTRLCSLSPDTTKGRFQLLMSLCVLIRLKTGTELMDVWFNHMHCVFSSVVRLMDIVPNISSHAHAPWRVAQ